MAFLNLFRGKGKSKAQGQAIKNDLKTYEVYLESKFPLSSKEKSLYLPHWNANLVGSSTTVKVKAKSKKDAEKVIKSKYANLHPTGIKITEVSR